MVNDFEPLAKQEWPRDIFYELSKDQAIRLLEGLRDANPDYNFLTPVRTGYSILMMKSVKSQANFNVGLLLTILQRNSEECQRKAQKAVNELRKKAVTMEQLDRAEFAKAASFYAIASGSLDLYGETVKWQQRFALDPPSVRVMFGRSAVITIEGIELLSGIPQPLPEDIKLAEVASRVEKANEILMTFHETMRIAKREPSFHQPDWAAVTSLFGAVITQRVARAKDLQKRLQGSEADLYTPIWGGTLAMLEKVSVDISDLDYKPIKTLLEMLPPTALAVMTKAMLEVGNEKRRNKKDDELGNDLLERFSYEALLRLAKSEKPELAQQLILRTIVDRPDASSWHRKLLSMSFMKRLSAHDAHRLLLDFATAIGEKLEEQSHIKAGPAQPLLSTQPPVKVTTVKYLAQLLENAEFISADAAVEVLVELFKVKTHIDIRLATLQSLLSLLNKLCSGAEKDWRSNALVEKVLKTIEIMISVVGSINERRPLLPEDWEEARRSGTLPDISDVSAGLPPLLKAILTASDGLQYQYPQLKNLQAEFVSRFLLPILEYSQVEHRKWLAFFLAKYKANLTVDDLPPTPITSVVWNTLIGSYPDFIPQTVLEDFNRHIVMGIAPFAALKDFKKSLRRNANLRNIPEVQHWLSVFDRDARQYRSSGTQTLVKVINRHWPSTSILNAGITFRKVLDMLVEHASLFLDEYEYYRHIWTALVDDLRYPTKSSYPHEDADSIRSKVSIWQKAGRLVLEELTTLLLDKKHRTKLENKLSILTSSRKLRLWHLPYPCFPDRAEIEHDCHNFARELEELLESFLFQEEANAVIRWPQIAKDACAVSQLLNTAEERLRVAFYIGKLTTPESESRDQKSSAFNLVRVTLAMKLIEDGRDALDEKKTTTTANKSAQSSQEREKDPVSQLTLRLEEWRSDSDEGIREKVAEWKNTKLGNGVWNILMTDEPWILSFEECVAVNM